MSEVVLKKLRLSGRLSAEDEDALSRSLQPSRTYRDGDDLIADGDAPGAVRAIISGFACRYKVLRDGRRQIVALLVPGDICDLQVSVLRRMDHAIGALTRCVVMHLQTADIEALSARPGLRRAFWWSSLVDEAVLRQWIVGMGQRPADQQLAHLFCELEARLAPLGLVHNNRFALPLSQEEVGDVLGLSAVHVNRTLQHLRAAGLAQLTSGVVHMPDVARLSSFCGFDAGYLHHDPDRVAITSHSPRQI